MSDDQSLTGDDERASEVEDYTDRIPRVEVPDDLSGLDDAGVTGFGDGDIADVDDDDITGGDEATAETMQADHIVEARQIVGYLDAGDAVRVVLDLGTTLVVAGEPGAGLVAHDCSSSTISASTMSSSSTSPVPSD